ncbi:MAG: ATP-binding protein [Shimia sp.]
MQLDLSVVTPGAGPGKDRRPLFDISGRTVIQVLRARYDVISVDLSAERDVTVTLRHAGRTLALGFSRSRVEARNPHQLLVIMLLAGLVLTLVAFNFMRIQLRPILRLAEVAEAFGRGQTKPYRPSGAREVRAAGQAFLDMRARLERQIEQRTLLLSGVSHDLRTPLTRLRLGLSMLPADDEEVADLIRDTEDMQRMLDAFLDFARDGMAEEVAATDPIALVRQVVEDAQRGGGRIALEAPETGPTMALRPVSLKRAVQNLVSNAVRHGARCEVAVAVTPRALTISVSDDGPGIPDDEREAALRPFTRLGAERDQNKGGSVGLGLAIVADVVRRHGGTLRLGESTELGGLRADMVLPRGARSVVGPAGLEPATKAL